MSNVLSSLTTWSNHLLLFVANPKPNCCIQQETRADRHKIQNAANTCTRAEIDVVQVTNIAIHLSKKFYANLNSQKNSHYFKIYGAF